MRFDRSICKTELGYSKICSNPDVTVRKNSGSAGVMKRDGLGKRPEFPTYQIPDVGRG